MKRQLAVLKVLLAQEKRKAGVLVILALVLLASIGRAFFALSPRTGEAAPTDESAGISSLAQAGRAAVSRAIASDDSRHGGRTVGVPHSPRPSRNVFALDPEQFPPPTQPTAPAPSNAVNADGPVESVPPIADDDPRVREARLVEETTGWRLKSVVLGATPLAVVEPGEKQSAGGKSIVLRKGQSFREWVVVEIAASSMVIEKESVRVRLALVVPER